MAVGDRHRGLPRRRPFVEQRDARRARIEAQEISLQRTDLSIEETREQAETVLPAIEYADTAEDCANDADAITITGRTASVGVAAHPGADPAVHPVGVVGQAYLIYLLFRAPDVREGRHPVG